MPSIPDSIVEELRLLDPAFEVQWCECKGGDHSGCVRSWDGATFCDVYVIWRRLREGALVNRFAALYFGRDWEGPYPERIHVLSIPPRMLDRRVITTLAKGMKEHERLVSETTRPLEQFLLEKHQQKAHAQKKKEDEFWEAETEGFVKTLSDSNPSRNDS